MSRKGSNVAALGPPQTENRRMSMAKGLGVPNDSSRRSSNVVPKTSVSTGPSLVGLLASQRLAKRLTTRFFNRKGGRLGNRQSTQIHVQKEPSYRMEPHKKFSPTEVTEVITEVLEGKLEKFKYNSKFCANISKVLSDEIKDKVKRLNYDRYKIVCHVTIGEKKGQNIMSCSRSIWDHQRDSFAEYTFQNKFIFCTASVFGLYCE